MREAERGVGGEVDGAALPGPALRWLCAGLPGSLPRGLLPAWQSRDRACASGRASRKLNCAKPASARGHESSVWGESWKGLVPLSALRSEEQPTWFVEYLRAGCERPPPPFPPPFRFPPPPPPPPVGLDL